MAIYDYSKLLGKIKEMNLTQEEFAHLLGRSPSTINLKLKNKKQFSQGEMHKAMEVLEHPLSKIPDYFFCH